jgi:hypothetical protein
MSDADYSKSQFDIDSGTSNMKTPIPVEVVYEMCKKWAPFYNISQGECMYRAFNKYIPAGDIVEFIDTEKDCFRNDKNIPAFVLELIRYGVFV